jgi:hypothetical protein
MSYVPPVGIATTNKPGIIQLAGDLAGTATAPEVSKIKGVSVTGTPEIGQTLVAIGSTQAAWQSVSSGSGGVAANQVTGVVIETNGVYPTRPTGFANVKFIGVNDPGSAAQNGDEWVKL